MTYSEEIPDYGDVFDVASFRRMCTLGAFNDYDGEGHPAKDGKMTSDVWVKPSKVGKVPEDATHVVWFNK